MTPSRSVSRTADILTYFYSIVVAAAAVVTFLVFVNTVAQPMTEIAAALQYSSQLFVSHCFSL